MLNQVSEPCENFHNHPVTILFKTRYKENTIRGKILANLMVVKPFVVSPHLAINVGRKFCIGHRSPNLPVLRFQYFPRPDSV